MKRTIFFILFILANLLFYTPARLSSFPDPLINYPQKEDRFLETIFSLDNGLKVYFLPDYNTTLSAVVLAVKAGVAEETPETNGYLHLLEHCLLFRQNHLTRDNYLLQLIKENGLYYNAHTEQDLMFFEICLPVKNLEIALNLLRKVVFDFDLTEEGLEKEKKIVLQELKEIERNPQKIGLAKIYEMALSESGYGLPVFGQEQVIRDATLTRLRDFHARLFSPQNSALVIVGSFDSSRLREEVEKYFSDLKPGNILTTRTASPTKLLTSSSQVELTMKIAECYLLAGLVGPGYNHPDQIGLDLLVAILGRGLNPLLFSAFAGYPDLVSSASVHYLCHERAGLIFFSFNTKEDKVTTVRRLVQNFFLRLSEINYSPEDYLPGEIFTIDFLQAGKNQVRWLSEKALEQPLDLAMAMAKHLLLADKLQAGNYLDSIVSYKSSDLRKIARQYFSKGKPVWVVIKPEKK